MLFFLELNSKQNILKITGKNFVKIYNRNVFICVNISLFYLLASKHTCTPSLSHAHTCTYIHTHKVKKEGTDRAAKKEVPIVHQIHT